MPHDIGLISLIAVGLCLAMLLGFVANALRLPPLVGYLLAGILLGPSTPGMVADLALAGQLAEIGVMLLMFGVGLHFSMNDLMAVRRIALRGAVVQIGVATLMGMGLGLLWGWPWGQALVFGLALSVASTVVLLRALESRQLLDSVNGKIAVGWLVVEDLVMVLVLVLLPPLAGLLGGENATSTSHSTAHALPIWQTIALTLGKVAAFIAFMLIVGRRLFPKILWWVSQTGSRELFTLCVIAAALGIAYGSAQLFGVSFALGAFFAGVVLSESDLSHRAAEESLPLRDAFSVLFFVSVGMLFDPHILLEQPWHVLAVVLVIVLGKTLAAMGLVLFFRYPLNTALTVGASLAQIGEFSFILASLGLSLKLLTLEAQNLILAGAMISIALNSFLFTAIEPVQRFMRERSPLARLLERSGDPLAMLPMSVDDHYLTGQIVLVGYGVVGRRIAHQLQHWQVHYVVVDEQRDLIEQLRGRNVAAVCGNAAEPAVLVQAHVHKASMLIVSIVDTFNIARMTTLARTLNPNVEIVVCSDSAEESELLQNMEKTHVFRAEHTLADAMLKQIHSRMGNKTETH